jgi:DNA-binding response OmpR family regulator
MNIETSEQIALTIDDQGLDLKQITFTQLLQHFLTKHGHVVKAANTIKDGIKLEQKFDLLLLDYRLLTESRLTC